MTVVPITSHHLDAAEVSWFAALCSDDYQFLGVPDGDLRSSWEHCSAILREAEKQGFRNILCPSSYQVGQDTLSFVAGNAPITTLEAPNCLRNTGNMFTSWANGNPRPQQTSIRISLAKLPL